MRKRIVGFAVLVVLGMIMAGCAEGPASSSTNPIVTMTASFSKTGELPGLLKASGTPEVDSLLIDSAVVILQRVKFESHIDSAEVDSSDMDDDGEESEEEINVTMRGPFVVHIRDTVSIDFASQTLPAGTYDGIKFKVHRLRRGEHHEDSDEHGGRRRVSVDSLPYGSSVMIWGWVKKNGAWSTFTFAFDGELEFKVKGNFTVSEATSMVNFALNFNMGVWFTTPTGVLLDPTDASSRTRQLIRESIKRSFQQCRGGRDRDDDGHPDD